MGGFIYTGHSHRSDVQQERNGISRLGLYAGPVVGFFVGGLLAKYSGHYSIYYASGKRMDLSRSLVSLLFVSSGKISLGRWDQPMGGCVYLCALPCDLMLHSFRFWNQSSRAWLFFVAILGLLWSLAFVFLIYDKPREHPSISEEELIYIEKSIAEVKSLYDTDEVNQINEIPWKSILTSLPVWAISCAHFARGWTFYLLLTNQPAFLNAFGFGVSENGTLGSLPHMMKVCIALLSGFIADYMRWNLMYSTTNVRKVMTCTGTNRTVDGHLSPHSLSCFQDIWSKDCVSSSCVMWPILIWELDCWHLVWDRVV